MKKNILIISAHPDDETLGCGGTIALLKSNKHRVKIIYLADGVTARFERQDIYSDIAKKKIKERKDLSLKSNRNLGINKKDIKFFDLDCCRLDQFPIIDLAKIIEKEIKSFKPSIIFTNSFYDLNVDHKKIYEATLIATRPNVYNFIEEIYSYEVMSSSNFNLENPFKPNTFVDISKFMKKKKKSLKLYKSEIPSFPHPRSIKMIESLAMYRGSQSGYKFAEGFRLLRKNIKF